jgi:hypothetical protein
MSDTFTDPVAPFDEPAAPIPAEPREPTEAEQAQFVLMQMSTVMGARMVASKMQQQLLNGEPITLSEDEQRIVAEAEEAAKPAKPELVEEAQPLAPEPAPEL